MALNGRILILGSAGQLGKEFVSVCARRNLEFLAPDESKCQITQYDQIDHVVRQSKPEIIINCAAYNDVDLAEADNKIVNAVNRDAVGHLAELSERKKIFLVHFSSDYIFDGTKGEPYSEEDLPSPLNAYGKSKLEGENLITERMDNFLIFRLSWVIGEGKSNFLYKFTQWAAQNEELSISDDEISTPTFTDEVVDITLKSLEKGLRGIYHLTNTGYTSRFGLARAFCDLMGLECKISPVSRKSFETKAERPAFSCMSNKKLSQELSCEISSWEDGLKRYVARLKGGMN